MNEKETKTFVEKLFESIPECLLPWDKYSDLYKAIQDDDIKTFEMKLVRYGKELIVNGKFDLVDLNSYCDEKTRGCFFQPNKPFTLAVIHCSFKILNLMLRNGVDVDSRDWNQGNVLHCAVAFASLYPNKEPQMCKLYKFLNEKLDRMSMTKLLMSENEKGIRPLEMAGQLGMLGLFRAIFETKDVYLAKVEICGLFYHKLYDITEYESITQGNRFYKSPLHFLAHLDHSHLDNPRLRAFIDWKAIHNWTSGKLDQNKWLIFLWFLFRLFFIALFQIFSMSHVTEEFLEKDFNNNKTLCDASIPIPKTVHMVIVGVLLTMASAVIVLDIYEFIWWKIQK